MPRGHIWGKRPGGITEHRTTYCRAKAPPNGCADFAARPPERVAGQNGRVGPFGNLGQNGSGLGGFVVNVIHYSRESGWILRPRTLALAALLMLVVLLQVAIVLGAQDCMQGADSFLCSFAKMSVG